MTEKLDVGWFRSELAYETAYVTVSDGLILLDGGRAEPRPQGADRGVYSRHSLPYNRPMDEARLRAWHAHRQGLDGSLEGSTPARALERAGWARSIGGAAPYLAIHARCGASRVW